ncbi:MAG: DNA adenine methylase [Chloroflexota bacterium]
MKTPHPIPYQGSKRHIAKYILPFFPKEINTLIEPFAGSAAVSIAAACYGKASHFHLNDLNQPLTALWHEIINDPKGIAERYKRLWEKQLGKEREYYDFVRDQFNKTKRPDYLLYLLARCVKASVRYNAKGEFNQSPDNRRLGRNPEQMAEDIFSVSNLFKGRVIITSKEYQEIIKTATKRDLVYLDPPYQGVCSSGDPRYYSGVDFDEFMTSLKYLVRQSIPFILSYDGRTGNKVFGKELPAELELHRVEVAAGRSTQSTLLGGDDITYESLYLSKDLAADLEISPQDLINKSYKPQAIQLSLSSN